MRPISLALCTVIALAPVTALAAAPASGVSGDARCLMTMAALTASKDPKQAQLATVGVAYFTGRVKAQDPSFNFATRLKPVAAEMTRAALTSEAQRCGPLLTASLRELDSALQSISPKPAAAAKPAAGKPATKPAPAPKP